MAASLNFSFLVFAKEVPAQYYLSQGIKTFFEALDFYLVYLILVPMFFDRKRIGVFLLAVLIYFCLFVPIYLLANYFEETIENLRSGNLPTISRFLSANYYTVLYAFLGGFFRLAVDGIKSNQQKAVLEKENAKNELAFLKSQINPHFLYNVLNTIHSYINSNNPNASKAVIKLSDIMRYMLSDTNKEFIILKEEVEYLASYIELQNYRIEKPDFVDFVIDGDIGKILIPPLILIPFVENAFKHGKKDVKSPGIKIGLKVNSSQLFFTVENYLSPVSNNINREEHIGLTNAYRRLDLLFPDKHDLVIDQDEYTFSVALTLDLIK